MAGSTSPWATAPHPVAVGNVIVAAMVAAALAAAAWSASAEPGWLGVRLAEGETASGKAARLAMVAQQSPAEHAGLRDGDLVLAAGARRVGRARDLVRIVARHRPGHVLRLEVERAGTRFPIDVALATRPAGFERLFEHERDQWQEPDRVLDAMRIAPGSTVADLGAGGGYFTERLAARVGPTGRVVAIEIDRGALRALARRFPEGQYPMVRVQRGFATDPALDPGSVDAVLIVDTYHELTDPVAMLAALRVALRPGGRVAIADWPTTEWIPGAHAIPESRVKEQLHAAGFQEIERLDLQRQFLVVFERAPK